MQDKGSRLDSWKRIAAYLNRDVRTAHRWERDEGLPVYRHQHGKAGTVYAYPDEIDAWLQRRSAGSNGKSADAAASSQARTRAIAAGAAVVIAALALLLLGAWPSAPENTIRILVTTTENRTGEDRFDGLLDAFLQGELRTAKIEVIPPRRIVETLALMREQTDRVLNDALMLEIAARNPDVDLIASSSLDRFSGEYMLTAELLDPVSGMTLDTVRRQASDETDIPSALARLVAGTIDAVSAIELPERNTHMGHEPVTTNSLRAAELYWDANLLMFDNSVRLPAAEEQLREAIALDPDFATAWIQLAYAIHEQGRPAADWEPVAERALRLTDAVSQPERYFVTGSYQLLHGKLDEAHAQLLALNESHPEHFWGQVRMAELSHARGNVEGAAWSMALAADLKPRSIEFNRQAFNFILTTPHPWTLERIHARMLATRSPSENGGVLPFFPAEFFTVNDLLSQGRADAALDELRSMEEVLDGFPDDVWTRRSEYAARLAEVYLAFGRLADAERLQRIILEDNADDIRNSPFRRLLDEQRLLALISVSRNDDCCLLSGAASFYLAEFTLLQLRSGQITEGNAYLQRLISSGAPVADMLQAEIAYANADYVATIELAESVLSGEAERLRSQSLAPGQVTPVRRETLLVADTLARALTEAGRTDEAIRVLETWSNETIKVGALMSSPPFSPYWTQLRWNLAALYREAGRNEDADTIETYLETLFALADQDHYIAAQLRAADRR